MLSRCNDFCYWLRNLKRGRKMCCLIIWSFVFVGCLIIATVGYGVGYQNAEQEEFKPTWQATTAHVTSWGVHNSTCYKMCERNPMELCPAICLSFTVTVAYNTTQGYTYEWTNLVNSAYNVPADEVALMLEDGRQRLYAQYPIGKVYLICYYTSDPRTINVQYCKTDTQDYNPADSWKAVYITFAIFCVLTFGICMLFCLPIMREDCTWKQEREAQLKYMSSHVYKARFAGVTSFLSGTHAGLGKNSAMYHAFRKDFLYDPSLLPMIWEFVDGGKWLRLKWNGQTGEAIGMQGEYVRDLEAAREAREANRRPLFLLDGEDDGIQYPEDWAPNRRVIIAQNNVNRPAPTANFYPVGPGNALPAALAGGPLAAAGPAPGPLPHPGGPPLHGPGAAPPVAYPPGMRPPGQQQALQGMPGGPQFYPLGPAPPNGFAAAHPGANPNTPGGMMGLVPGAHGMPGAGEGAVPNPAMYPSPSHLANMRAEGQMGPSQASQGPRGFFDPRPAGTDPRRPMPVNSNAFRGPASPSSAALPSSSSFSSSASSSSFLRGGAHPDIEQGNYVQAAPSVGSSASTTPVRPSLGALSTGSPYSTPGSATAGAYPYSPSHSQTGTPLLGMGMGLAPSSSSPSIALASPGPNMAYAPFVAVAKPAIRRLDEEDSDTDTDEAPKQLVHRDEELEQQQEGKIEQNEGKTEQKDALSEQQGTQSKVTEENDNSTPEGSVVYANEEPVLVVSPSSSSLLQPTLHPSSSMSASQLAPLQGQADDSSSASHASLANGQAQAQTQDDGSFAAAFAAAASSYSPTDLPAVQPESDGVEVPVPKAETENAGVPSGQSQHSEVADNKEPAQQNGAAAAQGNQGHCNGSAEMPSVSGQAAIKHAEEEEDGVLYNPYDEERKKQEQDGDSQPQPAIDVQVPSQGTPVVPMPAIDSTEQAQDGQAATAVNGQQAEAEDDIVARRRRLRRSNSRIQRKKIVIDDASDEEGGRKRADDWHISHESEDEHA